MGISLELETSVNPEQKEGGQREHVDSLEM